MEEGIFYFREFRRNGYMKEEGFVESDHALEKDHGVARQRLPSRGAVVEGD
jgi:hypothetical protein